MKKKRATPFHRMAHPELRMEANNRIDRLEAFEALLDVAIARAFDKYDIDTVDMGEVLKSE